MPEPPNKRLHSSEATGGSSEETVAQSLGDHKDLFERANIPDEVLIIILTFIVNIAELMPIGRVSKRFRELIKRVLLHENYKFWGDKFRHCRATLVPKFLADKVPIHTVVFPTPSEALNDLNRNPAGLRGAPTLKRAFTFMRHIANCVSTGEAGCLDSHCTFLASVRNTENPFLLVGSNKASSFMSQVALWTCTERYGWVSPAYQAARKLGLLPTSSRTVLFDWFIADNTKVWWHSDTGCKVITIDGEPWMAYSFWSHLLTHWIDPAFVARLAQYCFIAERDQQIKIENRMLTINSVFLPSRPVLALRNLYRDIDDEGNQAYIWTVPLQLREDSAKHDVIIDFKKFVPMNSQDIYHHLLWAIVLRDPDLLTDYFEGLTEYFEPLSLSDDQFYEFFFSSTRHRQGIKVLHLVFSAQKALIDVFVARLEAFLKRPGNAQRDNLHLLHQAAFFNLKGAQADGVALLNRLQDLMPINVFPVPLSIDHFEVPRYPYPDTVCWYLDLLGIHPESELGLTVLLICSPRNETGFVYARQQALVLDALSGMPESERNSELTPEQQKCLCPDAHDLLRTTADLVYFYRGLELLTCFSPDLLKKDSHMRIWYKYIAAGKSDPKEASAALDAYFKKTDSVAQPALQGDRYGVFSSAAAAAGAPGPAFAVKNAPGSSAN